MTGAPAPEERTGVVSDDVWLPASDPAARAPELAARFRSRYGREATGVWAAPGRVNLLGEHVDYSGGTCLPFALPHTTLVAAAPRRDGVLRALSTAADEQQPREVEIARITPESVPGWFGYVAGVAWAMGHTDAPHLPELPDGLGADLLIDSSVPVGAGLSSSAALETAVALALTALAGDPAPRDATRAALARACMAAENDVVGAATGGLDQTAALRSREDTVLALDCRDFSVRPVGLAPAGAGLEFVVVDTRAPHQLADGQYEARRRDCAAAAEALGADRVRDLLPERPTPQAAAAVLRRWNDVVDRDVAALGGLDRDVVHRRLRHALTEMVRVQTLIELCGSGPLGPEQWREVGGLLSATHSSLRDDYEVSVPRLDTVVATAVAAGALGARLVGGGFGGSVLCLVPRGRVSAVVAAVTEEFGRRGWDRPRALAAVPSAPARRVL